MEIKVNLENNKVDIHMTSDEVLKLMSNLTRLLVELSDSQMKGGVLLRSPTILERLLPQFR